MITWLWMGIALAGAPMSLDAALDAARTAPGAGLAQVESERGRAERLSAQAWSNPSVDYQGYGRTRGSSDAINGQQHQVDLGVVLPITGELAARLGRGRLAEQLGRARAGSRYALLAEEVGRAWFELLAAQEREVVLEDARSRLAALVEITEARASDGAARPWDVNRMRLALTALERQLALSRGERRAAEATLAARLGRDEGGISAEGDLDRALVIRADAASSSASPFVHEAVLAVEHRELAAREARRSRIPEPELRVGGYWTVDGDSSSVVAGIGWDLPVFDRGQGRVAAAAAERWAAAEEARRVESSVAAERRAILSAMEDLRRAAEVSPVPEGAVLSAAEVAWTEGEASILEVVDAVSAEVEQRIEALDVALELRLLELRLATLDGSLAPRVRPR